MEDKEEYKFVWEWLELEQFGVVEEVLLSQFQLLVQVGAVGCMWQQTHCIGQC